MILYVFILSFSTTSIKSKGFFWIAAFSRVETTASEEPASEPIIFSCLIPRNEIAASLMSYAIGSTIGKYYRSKFGIDNTTNNYFTLAISL